MYISVGQHRNNLLPAATHHNCKVFLACVRRTLTPTAAAGRLSIGDVHSLLLMLCPDFPLAAVKNAWSSAVAIQACKGTATTRIQCIRLSAAQKT